MFIFYNCVVLFILFLSNNWKVTNNILNVLKWDCVRLYAIVWNEYNTYESSFSIFCCFIIQSWSAFLILYAHLQIESGSFIFYKCYHSKTPSTFPDIVHALHNIYYNNNQISWFDVAKQIMFMQYHMIYKRVHTCTKFASSKR